MAGDRLCIGEAGVLHHAGVDFPEELRGVVNGLLELRLVGLVGVDAEEDVLPADEVELRGRVVEPGDSEDVAHSVPVESGVGGDDEFVLFPHLHVCQIHESRR